MEQDYNDLIKNLEIEEDLTNIFEQMEIDTEKEQN
jgi:hypothetical protein